MKLYTKKDRLLLWSAIVLGGINAALSAFISILLQQIIDVATHKDMDGFTDLFFVMLIYLAGLGIIGFLEAYCGKLLLRNVSVHLRERIFTGVIKRSPDSYHSQNTADYLSALVNDVKIIEENYLIPLLICSQMLVLFLTTLGILFYLSPLVTAVLLVFLILMFLIPALLGKNMQKRQDAYSEKLAGFTSQTKDYLNGYEIIQGYSLFSYIYRKFFRINKETADKKFSADKLLAVNESFSDVLSSLSITVIIFLAAYLMMTEKITMGTLLALVQLSGTFVTPVVLLMQNAPKIASIKPILERLNTLQKPAEKHPESDHTEPDAYFCDTAPGHFRHSLLCSQVTFGYDQNNPVLRQLSLRIDAGKKYALLGESGCGKTTLIKLLTGYSKDFAGTISYDGRSVSDMPFTEINRLVSVIHQNVFLFDTDIAENICLGQNYPDHVLQQVLDESGVAQFLPDLENGLHTKAGENGNNLSGGQKQRIAIARALIRNTPILIIDEGTSAVDIQASYEIEQKLLRRKELTVICITHHMNEFLEPCYDKILHMKDGRIC
ncbi:MAG: ABC transporter ATP-binding protein [Eubacteriales bacterium]|nr:ABC transporter ATP-binding protein [Eubacteriales bacterium]